MAFARRFAKSEAEAEFALDKEYLVRYYLEGHSEAYGFEIAGDARQGNERQTWRLSSHL